MAMASVVIDCIFKGFCSNYGQGFSQNEDVR